ncbi:Pectin lyase-like superfamily protein [Abeliophyllum distichum]|uniref:Pectin lyase-like superfamily protein n=1 Tax=Abeliophyllum distichum TaxID=126358 RepID=A0ABD1QWU2_9LAMI
MRKICEIKRLEKGRSSVFSFWKLDFAVKYLKFRLFDVLRSVEDILSLIFILGLASSRFASLSIAWGNEDHFNVIDYGATSDGVTDDSQAFLKAWDAACSAAVEYPKGDHPSTKNLFGTVVAPSSPTVWDGRDASQWLAFNNVNGLNVDGFGTIDGQGKGRGGNYAKVEKIHISNSHFNRTTNGARIKTWQVGRGYIRKVTFQNLIFTFVKNPIIIDQNYCYPRNSCKKEKSGVQISDVTYKEIFGTSSTNIAINLNCSQSVPCYGIFMQSIQLALAEAGKQITANCSSAYGEEDHVFPGPCLSKTRL